MEFKVNADWIKCCNTMEVVVGNRHVRWRGGVELVKSKYRKAFQPTHNGLFRRPSTYNQTTQQQQQQQQQQQKPRKTKSLSALSCSSYTSKAFIRYGPCVIRRSHSFTCHLHTNDTFTPQPQRRHRCLAATHCAYR